MRSCWRCFCFGAIRVILRVRPWNAQATIVPRERVMQRLEGNTNHHDACIRRKVGEAQCIVPPEQSCEQCKQWNCGQTFYGFSRSWGNCQHACGGESLSRNWLPRNHLSAILTRYIEFDMVVVAMCIGRRIRAKQLIVMSISFSIESMSQNYILDHKLQKPITSPRAIMSNIYIWETLLGSGKWRNTLNDVAQSDSHHLPILNITCSP